MNIAYRAGLCPAFWDIRYVVMPDVFLPADTRSFSAISTHSNTGSRWCLIQT